MVKGGAFMKKISMFLLLSAILFSMSACASYKIELDIDGAEKMTAFSGSTGKHIDITDKDIITTITNGFTDHEFTNAGWDRNNEGFAYIVTWYDADGNTLDEVSVLNGHRISYNDCFYDKEECRCVLPIWELEQLFSESMP